MCIAIGNGRGEKLHIAPTPRLGDPPEVGHIFDEPEWVEDDGEPEKPVRL
jgi:hypothetical protein